MFHGQMVSLWHRLVNGVRRQNCRRNTGTVLANSRKERANANLWRVVVGKNTISRRATENAWWHSAKPIDLAGASGSEVLTWTSTVNGIVTASGGKDWRRTRPGPTKDLLSGGQAFVAMVKSTNFREGYDPSRVRSAHRARFGSILAQRQVRSAPMIIGEIAREQPVQVSLAEHDDMVQTFAADRTNQPFDIRGLPRGARRNPEFLQSENARARAWNSRP